SWSWPEESPQAGLRRLYYDLLTLRRFRLPLSEFREASARFADNQCAPSAILRLGRHGVCNGQQAGLVGSFDPAGPAPALAVEERPASGLLVSSESKSYGGARREDDLPEVLYPFEFQVYGPDATSTP